MTRSNEYYEELAGRLRGLAISLDSLLGTWASAVDEYLDHAEYGLALETIVWRVCEQRLPVPAEALAEIRRLAAGMGIEDELPEDLADVPIL